MNRYKHHVVVLVHELYDFMHSALVVLHAHKAAEDSDAVVDMDYIVADGE